MKLPQIELQYWFLLLFAFMGAVTWISCFVGDITIAGISWLMFQNKYVIPVALTIGVELVCVVMYVLSFWWGPRIFAALERVRENGLDDDCEDDD